jgi:poly-beta-1,6-N-acetyl-D-glucosamine N-deacetylase
MVRLGLSPPGCKTASRSRSSASSDHSAPMSRTRTAIFRLLRLTFLPFVMRELFQWRRVTILVYHDPSRETLQKHLAVLRRRYSFVSLEEFVEAHAAGAIRSLPPRSLVISLDDGYAGNFELKPLFEELEARATIFLVSDAVGSNCRFWFMHVPNPKGLMQIPDGERLQRLQELGFDGCLESVQRDVLSNEEVRELSRTVDFQSHTLSHPVLTQCIDTKAETEISKSKLDLERRYGFSIYALAYPNGNYAVRETTLAREAGYRCAVTVDSGFNSNRTDPFRLRRICIDDADGIDELIVKVSGLWGHVERIANVFRDPSQDTAPRVFSRPGIDRNARPGFVPFESASEFEASSSSQRNPFS